MRQLVDGDGVVTLVQTYDPYGDLMDSAGSGTSAFGFTGEAQVGALVYLRARFYAPRQGRFLSRDSWEGDWEEPLTQNRWLYGDANPVNRVDPSGHWTLQVGFFDRKLWALKEPGDSWYSLNRSLGIDIPFTQLLGPAPDEFLLSPFIDILIQETARLGIGKTYRPKARGMKINCYPAALSCAAGECLHAYAADATAIDDIIGKNTFNLPGDQDLRYADLFRIAAGNGGEENWNWHTGMIIMRSNGGIIWTFNGYPPEDTWGPYRIETLDNVLKHTGNRPIHGRGNDPTGYYRLKEGIDAAKMRQALEAAGVVIHK